MLGLYERTRCYGYDGDARNDYEVLLAIGDDAAALVERWNAKQDAARKALIDKGRHSSYVDRVPPNMKKGTKRMEYSGNTGGGWRQVNNTLTVRKVKQFDDPD